MGKLVLNILLLFVFLGTFHCYPEHKRVPKNISPAEINYLVEPTAKENTNVQSQTSLDQTVNEVEDMLRANPNLPRLTRGEILDLLENITKSDPVPKIIQQVPQVSVNYQKSRDPKAIMMVLPFTPDAANENNVEDLYTKPPVTQIVDYGQLDYTGTNNIFLNQLPKLQNKKASENNKSTNTPGKKYKTHQLRKTKPASTSTTVTTTTTTTTTTPATTTTSTSTEPSRLNFVERRPHHRRKIVSTTTTTTSTTTVKPQESSKPSKGRRPTKSRTTVSPTTKRHPNHRYEDDIRADPTVSASSTMFPSNGMKVVQPPSLPPNLINEDLLAANDENKEIYTEKDSSISFVPIKEIDLTLGDSKEENNALPLVIEIPEHLKGVLTELNLESALKTKQKKRNKPKVKTTARPSPKPITSGKDDQQLKDLIKTLELLTVQTTTTTTSTPIPDVSGVVDNLSPDMKELLMNFGLIPNPIPPKLESDSQVYESYNPEKAEVNPNSYVGFKPLPEDDTSRTEMQELLARFGLGGSARKQKSLLNKNKESDLEMVPSEYQEILADLGVGDKNSHNSSQSTTQHVFNPSENLYATKDEIDKLNKLSDVVKQLESLNRTITDDDLKNLDTESLKVIIDSLKNFVALNDSTSSTKILGEQKAPDPVDFDYSLMKNEIKRDEGAAEKGQTESDAEKEKDQTESDAEKDQTDNDAKKDQTEKPKEKEEVTTTTTREETQTPNIKDLEDSFGGESMVTETPKPPPPTKHTGFYYLLDWNSFFDMDDQKGRRVNLRFQPKVGNPNMFYSVSVP